MSNNNKNEYDVIVIGAGLSGGLPAACYLQKAGARVLMVEANQEVGDHCKSNELFPGAMATPCAAGYFGGTSPMWDDLNLEDYGLRYAMGDRNFGAFFPDDTNLFVGMVDMEGSAADIARFSEKDAERFLTMGGVMMESFIELNEMMFYSDPDPRNLPRIYEILAEAAGIPVDMFVDMNGFELLDTMFEDHRIKQALLQPGVTGIFGDPGAKGQGAFNVLSAPLVGTGQLVGSNHSKVHALVRIFLDEGGTLWRNTPVERIITENGQATGIKISDKSVMHPGEIFTAKNAVISNAGTTNSLKLIGEDEVMAVDPRLAIKMKYFDNSTRASTVTIWALQGKPNWKSAAFNDYINKSDFFYKGKNSFEEWRSWYMAEKSGDFKNSFSGWWEMLIPAALDPGQASPEGVVTFRLEEIMPFYLRENGEDHAERWDDVKWDLVKQREDILEKAAPGFKSQIIDTLALSPLDLWRGNMASVCGNGVGGGFSADQWMFDRMPYRMPIKNLYMCNGVWPVSLSWGAPGYNAACCVAEDMGIRNQPWWKSRPGEWMMKNVSRLVV